MYMVLLFIATAIWCSCYSTVLPSIYYVNGFTPSHNSNRGSHISTRVRISTTPNTALQNARSATLQVNKSSSSKTLPTTSKIGITTNTKSKTSSSQQTKHRNRHYKNGNVNNNESNNHNNRKRKKKQRMGNYVFKNNAAYSELSDEELYQMTEQLLDTNITAVGHMDSKEIHDVGCLVFSWSKRSPYRYKGKNKSTPNETTKNTINHGFMAEKLLQRLYDEQKAGNKSSRPSFEMVNSIMNSWTKSGLSDGPIRAMKLLRDMEHHKHTYYYQRQTHVQGGGASHHHRRRHHRHHFPPKELHAIAKCYITAIDGLCKSKKRGYVEKAHELLGQLGRLTHSSDNNLQNPSIRDVKHFNLVLNAYASQTHYNVNAIHQAETLFNEMKRLSERGVEGVHPNRTTFNIMIKAFSNSRKKGSAGKAETVLHEMERAFSSGDKTMQPDKISYTSVLSAWARSGEARGTEKAEVYLSRMHQLNEKGYRFAKPDTMTYNNVINIIANSERKDAGDRSRRILEQMELLHGHGDHDAKPNIVSFNSVIKAYMNYSDERAILNCLELLDRLESFDEDSNESLDIKPDIVTYNSILNVFANGRDPASAENLLQRMEKRYASGESSVKPDLYSYNIVMGAWAKSTDRFAARNAEIIFEYIEKLHEEGETKLKPDITSYNTLLLAWSKSQNEETAERATQMLNLMLENESHTEPNVQSFSIAIDIWSKSNHPYKARKARELLLLMQRIVLEEKKAKIQRGEKEETLHPLTPNVYIYAAVLNACAFTYDKEKDITREALDIAMKTFSELQRSKHTSPNHVAYGCFLRACNRLMEKDYITVDSISRRRQLALVEGIFKQCCRDGEVGQNVLKEMYRLDLPPDTYKRLQLGKCLSDGVLGVGDVPKEWSHNVKERQSYGRFRRGKKRRH